MAQIKETIELLTKILRHNGTSKIKSEVFRQAKFDKDEAAPFLWRLLFEIIYYLKYRRIDDITIKAYAELSSEELCIYVKTEMKMRGFVSRSFHELPNDMFYGSRELLLTFGWLVCRSGLVEMFMEQCCTFLDGGEVAGDLDKLTTPRMRTAQHAVVKDSSERRDKVAYLMWLNGKLRLNLRNLNTLQNQRDRLTQRVHQLTQGVSVEPSARDHLTVLEVMMLKNPQLLQKNMKLLDADNQRLEALIAWQQHEDIFWKWMESVLDAKIADCGLIEEIDDKITPRTQATKQRLDSKLELAETVKKYEAIVSQLELEITNRQRRKVTVEEIDQAMDDLNSEISSHLDILLQASASSQESSTRPNSKQPPTKVRSLRTSLSRASSVTSSSVVEGEMNEMDSELSRLQVLVERLQTDIEYKQLKYHDDLTSVTSSMSSLCDYVTRGPVTFKQ